LQRFHQNTYLDYSANRWEFRQVVDFRQLPFSKPVRHKFGAISESRQLYPNQKTALVDRLLVCRGDLARGLHIPLSDDVRLRAKFNEDFGTLPHQITADVGTPLCFFTNPLLIPPGHDQPDFDVNRALPPMLRATNAGFLIVTIEHDCHSRDQFEEIVGLIAPSGRFKVVDAELRKYKEYCGYSAVYSGNRSICGFRSIRPAIPIPSRPGFRDDLAQGTDFKSPGDAVLPAR
jgi:hypothetical protein